MQACSADCIILPPLVLEQKVKIFENNIKAEQQQCQGASVVKGKGKGTGL